MKTIEVKKLERAVAVLAGAREKLSKGKWLKQAYARTAKGEHCNPRSKNAVAFCAFGAMEAAIKSYYVLDYASQLFRDANGQYPISFNDFHAQSKTDVTKAFTKAINLGKKKLKASTKK